jgi:hypothetical protein
MNNSAAVKVVRRLDQEGAALESAGAEGARASKAQRLTDLAFLSLVVGVQAAWIVVLVYGVALLLV